MSIEKFKNERGAQKPKTQVSGFSPQPSSLLPYGKQNIADDDIAAVVEALHADFLTTGPRVAEFEKALADYCGARHAIAVCNGTAALHVAMLAAGLKPGDRVLTSANTFLASANCAEFVGATADFADTDPVTCNVTADTLRAAWKDDVRAVVPVDFAGRPCDMSAIASLARERGALVIEDACHALGSEIIHEGRRYKVGGHPWADMTCLSFHPVKTITTGEGGAILTNDDRLAERCRLFRNHGMKRAEGGNLKPETTSETQVSSFKSPPSPLPQVSGFSLQSSFSPPPLSEHGPWYYEMTDLGYNYRITDFQCALGLSQLRKLDGFIRRRAEIVAAYNEAFHWRAETGNPKPETTSETQVSSFKSPPSPPPQVSSFSLPPSAAVAWHLYVLQLDFAALGKTRTQVMAELRQRGVGTQVHYIPVHLQPYYRRKYGYGPGKCPVAEACYPRCLSLPLYPSMTDADVRRVIQAVKEVIQP